MRTEDATRITDRLSMTYEQALQFWYGRVNYEQRSPKSSDLTLDRMRALLETLGNPERRLRIVHVAGSKGKGSTSALLASILRQAGYRAGLFTSPHLSHVEERIQVHGAPIHPGELATLMEDIRAAVESMEARRPAGGAVTFFEVATALGFIHFVRRRVDVAIIEVGLGGRFDSTNACRPLLSVITSISFDHTEQLGTTLASIAMEKAGIIKPGCPAISGARAPEARAVIEGICRERAAPLLQLDTDLGYDYIPGRVDEQTVCLPLVRIRTPRNFWPVMELGLLGEHQAANAALAVAAVERLADVGLSIDMEHVARGLAQVEWPARLEVLSLKPCVVLDCAHNVASAQALVDTLTTSFPGPTRANGRPGNGASAAPRRLLIFAASTDKDLSGMLGILAPTFTHVFLTRYDNARSAAPHDLAERLRRCADTPCTLCPTAAEAWQAALAFAGPDDLICVTGSVFLAGQLRPLMINCLHRD
jgi:dihydrofolate synthase/folylpolyglutamate synthase